MSGSYRINALLKKAPLVLIFKNEDQRRQAREAITMGRMMAFVDYESISSNLFRVVSASSLYDLILAIMISDSDLVVLRRFGVYALWYDDYLKWHRLIYAPSGAGKTTFIKTHPKYTDGDDLMKGHWPSKFHWWEDQATNAVVTDDWRDRIRKFIRDDDKSIGVLSACDIRPDVAVLPSFSDLLMHRRSRGEDSPQPNTLTVEEYEGIVTQIESYNVPTFKSVAQAAYYLENVLRSVPGFVSYAQETGSINDNHARTGRAVTGIKPWTILRKYIYAKYAEEYPIIVDCGGRAQNVLNSWDLRTVGIPSLIKCVNIEPFKTPYVFSPPDVVPKDWANLWGQKFDGQTKLSKRLCMAMDYFASKFSKLPVMLLYFGGSPGINWKRFPFRRIYNVDPRDCVKGKNIVHLREMVFPNNLDKYIDICNELSWMGGVLIMDDVRSDRTEEMSAHEWENIKRTQTKQSVQRCHIMLSKVKWPCVVASKFSIKTVEDMPDEIFDVRGELCIQMSHLFSPESVLLASKESNMQSFRISEYELAMQKWRTKQQTDPKYVERAMCYFSSQLDDLRDYFKRSYDTLHVAFFILSNITNLDINFLPDKIIFNYPIIPLHGDISLVSNDGYKDNVSYTTDIIAKYRQTIRSLTFTDAMFHLISRRASSVIDPCNVYESAPWGFFSTVIERSLKQTIYSSDTPIVKMLTVIMSQLLSLSGNSLYAFRYLACLKNMVKLREWGITEIKCVGVRECPMLLKYRGRMIPCSPSGHLINMGVYGMDIEFYIRQVLANFAGMSSEMESGGLWHGTLDFLVCAVIIPEYARWGFNVSNYLSYLVEQNFVDMRIRVSQITKQAYAERSSLANQVEQLAFMKEALYLNKTLGFEIPLSEFHMV